MRARLTTLAVVSFLFTACGGAGGAGSPGLAYGLPSPTSVTYVTGDTVVIDMNAMGQIMQVNQGSSATYNTSFATTADGIEVTLTVEDFAARITQPMAEPVTADESGIEGPLVFTMGRRGDVTVSTLPTLSGNADMLFGGVSLANQFFPRLPDDAIAMGDSWTDTTSWEAEEGGGNVSVTVVSNFTVVGDTVVDGRALLKIDGTARTQMDTQSTIQGMDIFQSIDIASEGYLLWDTQVGLPDESHMTLEGNGFIEVSAAPEPFSMTLRGQSHSKLRN
jgi:hypothetical protein